MQPPPRTTQLLRTHICERAIRQLSIPLILNLRDLPHRLVIEDIDLAVNGLLFFDTLDDIACAHVHADGVTGRCDFMVETLDLGEGGLETVPLWLVLLAAFGFGDGVFERPIVIPELEFLKGRASCKELRDHRQR